MQPNPLTTPSGTIHERYRQLLRAGFTSRESAALIALADGIGHIAEGESPVATTWRWQEISGVEFIRYLAGLGTLGGPADGDRRGSM